MNFKLFIERKNSATVKVLDRCRNYGFQALTNLLAYDTAGVGKNLEGLTPPHLDTVASGLLFFPFTQKQLEYDDKLMFRFFF